MYCSATGERHCKCLNPLPKVNAARVDFRAALRKLWTDHAVFDALVLKSIIDGDQDTDFLVVRLKQNQVDIGDEVKEFISEAKGNQLTQLLLEHIKLAGDVAKAIKANRVLDLRLELYYDNAEEVGEFLLNLGVHDAINMFLDHAQMIYQMAELRYLKDFAKEIRLYDEYYNQILLMSDMIYQAIL